MFIITKPIWHFQVKCLQYVTRGWPVKHAKLSVRSDTQFSVQHLRSMWLSGVKMMKGRSTMWLSGVKMMKARSAWANLAILNCRYSFKTWPSRVISVNDANEALWYPPVLSHSPLSALVITSSPNIFSFFDNNVIDVKVIYHSGDWLMLSAPGSRF